LHETDAIRAYHGKSTENEANGLADSYPSLALVWPSIMSSFPPNPVIRSDAAQSLAQRISRIRESLSGPVRAVGFWSAILLPFGLVAMLNTGLEGGDLVGFVLLLVLNALALVVGHGYGR
jgi:hypothetical protein